MPYSSKKFFRSSSVASRGNPFTNTRLGMSVSPGLVLWRECASAGEAYVMPDTAVLSAVMSIFRLFAPCKLIKIKRNRKCCKDAEKLNQMTDGTRYTVAISNDDVMAFDLTTRDIGTLVFFHGRSICIGS